MPIQAGVLAPTRRRAAEPVRRSTVARVFWSLLGKARHAARTRGRSRQGRTAGRSLEIELDPSSNRSWNFAIAFFGFLARPCGNELIFLLDGFRASLDFVVVRSVVREEMTASCRPKVREVISHSGCILML